MSTQNIRLFLVAALVLVGMLLFNEWKSEHITTPIVASGETSKALTEQEFENKDIPTHAQEGEEVKVAAVPASQQIKISTDVMNVTLDTLGGDVIHIDLPAYAESREERKIDYTLMDHSADRYYIAQSGLTGPQGPDVRGVGRARYQAALSHYALAEGQNDLSVDLKTRTKEGIEITKRFIFHRNSYVIDLEYAINNQTKTEYKGSFYARLKRKPDVESGGSFLGVQTFTGAAIYTPETPYKKITFKDIEEKPLTQEIEGGWAGLVEHYFVSAWIPSGATKNTYQTHKLDNGVYSVGFIEPPVSVSPDSQKTIQARLYAGPEVTEVLEKLAPGLDLTVDYGILWPICRPIFWVLKQLYAFTGNWGVAIILITVLIKLLFYKLSASSYRSMGNMRKLQPKIEALKERCGEDKQKFSQAVMELYKKEKINPLGGCLPVLVQIPVFIALYYVLLGSVELRLAPFALWITDLSAKDPYYVLPILMGISMLIQQKLNPAPPDPIQAKVMMMMPIVFTVLFLNFPAGLVLYWFVNNVLSITQQWFITRNIELAAKKHGEK